MRRRDSTCLIGISVLGPQPWSGDIHFPVVCLSAYGERLRGRAENGRSASPLVHIAGQSVAAGAMS